jgi:hypothetical protein
MSETPEDWLEAQDGSVFDIKDVTASLWEGEDEGQRALKVMFSGKGVLILRGGEADAFQSDLIRLRKPRPILPRPDTRQPVAGRVIQRRDNAPGRMSPGGEASGLGG